MTWGGVDADRLHLYKVNVPDGDKVAAVQYGYGRALYQFRTLVRTRTFPNRTEVRSRVRGSG
jgi:hypothetical protein